MQHVCGDLLPIKDFSLQVHSLEQAKHHARSLRSACALCLLVFSRRYNGRSTSCAPAISSGARQESEVGTNNTLSLHNLDACSYGQQHPLLSETFIRYRFYGIPLQHRRANPTVSYRPYYTRSSRYSPWRASPSWQQPSSYLFMSKPSHLASTVSKASPLVSP